MFGPRVTRHYETGLDLGGLSQVASAELEKVLIATLEDPSTRKSLQDVARSVLEDDSVRAAIRPHLLEAAMWVAGAVTVGVIAGRALSRPKKSEAACSC